MVRRLGWLRMGWLVAVVAALLVCALPRTASAGDDQRSADTVLRERIERIRQLPPEDQARLRDALRRFRALPDARREELRRRASQVGPERLGELVGRDIARLSKKHAALRAERAEVVRRLGGAARFADLAPEERSFLEGEATRRFQRHVRRSVMGIGGPQSMEAFNTRTRAEKREILEKKMAELETRLLDEQPDEVRSEFVGWTPKQQKLFRRQLLADYRLNLVPSFVQGFDAQVVVPFLRKPPAERAAAAQVYVERARWFEMQRRLDSELGVSRSHLKLLADMGPTEWGRLRDVYDRSRELPDDERKLALEEEIRELHGRNADGDAPSRRRAGDPMRQLLREQRSRRRRSE